MIGVYLFSAIIILAGMFISPVWAVFILISLLVVILLNNCQDNTDKAFLISLFLVGLSLRLIVMSFIHFHLINNNFFPGAVETLHDLYEGSILFDEHNFLQAARNIASGMGEFKQYYFRNAHLAILSWIFSHFGYDPLWGKMINCLAGVLAALIVYRCARLIYLDYAVAKCAAVITMFYPSVFFWSITNLKDSIIMFLVLVFLLFALYFFRKPYVIYALCVFVVAWLVQAFRSGYFYLFSVFFIMMMLYLFLSRNMARIRAFLFIIACIFIIALPFSENINAVYRQGVAILVDKQFSNAVAGGSKNKYLLFSMQEVKTKGESVGPVQLGRAYLKGMLYFIFSPIPWKNYSFVNPIVIFQTILWYLFLPFIVLGIVLSLRRNLLGWATFIFLLVNISYLAIFEGNIGTLFRHRDVIMPIFFIFLGRGLTFKLKVRS